MGNRTTSDPLRFTGIDLGGRDGGVTRSRRKGYELEGGDGAQKSSSDDSDSDGDKGKAVSSQEREEALYQSAMARIRRAQEKGRTDVRLTQDELAAFERHRQREEEEDRRKRRAQRIAIPLSQLGSASRARRDSSEEDSPPQPKRHSLELNADQQPPMGYFPPSAPRTLRPPSVHGSSSHAPSKAAADRERADSPFTYSYVNASEHLGPSRHASDPASGRPLSRVSTREDTVSPPSRSSTGQGSVDPFQFMTGGSKSPYHSGSAPTKRAAGDTTGDVYSYLDSPSGDRPRSGSGGRGLLDDDYVTGPSQRDSPRIGSSGSRGRSREDGPLPPLPRERSRHEPERRSTRDRTPPPASSSSSKKSTAVQSPARRKSLVGSIGGLKSKRKGK